MAVTNFMKLSANHMRQSRTMVLSLGWTVHLTVLCRARRFKNRYVYYEAVKTQVQRCLTNYSIEARLNRAN